MRTVRLTVAALVMLITCGPCNAEIPSYHVTELGPLIEELFPGVTYPTSASTGLNENGDVVGEAPINDVGHQRGWIYTVEHGVVALPVLSGHTRGFARDVSDRDANGEVVIVGSSTYVVNPEVAVLWRFSTVTGEVLEMRSIGIPAGYDESKAIAVSNDGTVVGYTGEIGAFTNWKYDMSTQVLETFAFPSRVADLNNMGQVCGGVYRGDLFGNYEDLSDTYEPGDVMPGWAIENGGISAIWHRINDQGWVVGRAGTGISDGAGHYYVAIVRFADPIGWTGMPPISHLSLAGGINDQGDFMVRQGGVYMEETSQQFSFNELLAPEWKPLVDVYWSNEINDNRQVAGWSGHSILLTPLGEMIIPGDVNGDATVDLDDYCAWVTAPIDLNGDGVVDDADEQWLVARLAVFGFSVDDCNANGACDHCDIMDGISLDCDENDVPDECQPDCNSDGVPNVCEPDCNANGTPDPCDIEQGVSDDCNDNGIPDECDEVGGVTDVAVVYDPPQFMYQDSTFVEDILVVDAGIVDDVDVMLSYRYRIGYTKVELSHNGTTVTILDRPGHPQHLNGFVNFGYDPGIIDDDEFGPYLEDTGDFCCNFESIVSPPNYRPNEPLSAFDGMPVEGIWTFTMTTTPDFSSGDGIHGWGLTITRATVPPGVCCDQDLSGDGMVNVTDLLALLSAWGTADGDLTGDGTTDVADLLAMLAAWGPCA